MLAVCCLQGYFGSPLGFGEYESVAAAPLGCWVSKWQIGLSCGSEGESISFIQGVLSDGNALPRIARDTTTLQAASSDVTMVEGEAGFFTALYGRWVHCWVASFLTAHFFSLPIPACQLSSLLTCPSS
jgi:hypothetical protein